MNRKCIVVLTEIDINSYSPSPRRRSRVHSSTYRSVLYGFNQKHIASNSEPIVIARESDQTDSLNPHSGHGREGRSVGT